MNPSDPRNLPHYDVVVQNYDVVTLFLGRG